MTCVICGKKKELIELRNKTFIHIGCLKLDHSDAKLDLREKIYQQENIIKNTKPNLSFLDKIFGNKKVKQDTPETEGSKYMPKQQIPIDELFASNFINNGGKFIYCGSFEEVLENFNNISPSDFKVKCDYNKLTENQSVLIPEITKSPKGVKNIKLNQKHIEFIILK